MADKFLGEWERYTPSVVRDDAPPNTMFARRKSDGQDWYELAHNPNNFAPGSVKITVEWRDNASAWIVGAANYDAASMFPPGFCIYELASYSGSNPQADLGGKAYDPQTGMFSEAVYAPAPEPQFKHEKKIFEALDHILNRLDALEKK